MVLPRSSAAVLQSTASAAVTPRSASTIPARRVFMSDAPKGDGRDPASGREREARFDERPQHVIAERAGDGVVHAVLDVADGRVAGAEGPVIEIADGLLDVLSADVVALFALGD